MAVSPEPGCVLPLSSPNGSPAAEDLAERSMLMVTTRSITSLGGSSCMSDDRDASKASKKSGNLPGNSSPAAYGHPAPTSRHISNRSDASMSSISLEPPQSTKPESGHPPRTASGSHVLPRCLARQTRDSSTSTGSVDAGNRSYITTDSCASNNSRGSDAGVKPKPRTSFTDIPVKGLGRQLPIKGSIDSFCEYIRPNAENSFLFSFTPMTRTDCLDTTSFDHALIGHLEKLRVERRPSQPSQKSVRLRRRRGVDVRSLTFAEWRPSSDSQNQGRQDLPFRGTQQKSLSDPVLRGTEAVQEAKTTEDRRRFDYLVSRLQQKLSERSSTKEPSTSDASRRSSQAVPARPSSSAAQLSARGSSGPSTAWPLADTAKTRSSSPPTNHGAGDTAINANSEKPDQPRLHAQPHIQPQPAPAPYLHRPFPEQVQMHPSASAGYMPGVLPSMVHQNPDAWNLQGGRALNGEGQLPHLTTVFPEAYPPRLTQPFVNGWPSAGVPSHYGPYPYTRHPQPTAPVPPPPHPSFPLPVAAPKGPHKPQLKKSNSGGRMPFVPLSPGAQQKIEEHIEFLKATVPSFAMVSKRRQQLRWKRENMKLEQHDEGMQKRTQSDQPFAPPPFCHWSQQPYQQLYQQYYQQMLPAATVPRTMVYNHPQPFYHAIHLPQVPWS